MLLKLGDSIKKKLVICLDDIDRYVELTGDYNSLHMDREEAIRYGFRDRVVHGMLTAGLISSVIGTEFPGPGTIYLSQDIRFVAPVYVGDTIEVSITVIEIINKNKGIYRLDTLCRNQDLEKVICGNAVVKYQVNVMKKSDRQQINNNNVTFLSEIELDRLGLKSCGKGVLISRNCIIYNPEKVEIGDYVRIDDFAILSGKIILRNFIHIAQYSGLYGGEEGIIMEDFSGLSSKVTIYATSNDYSGEYMTNPMVPRELSGEGIKGTVRIMKHSVIGCNSVILPGVTVGTGVAVGAMSLCNRDMGESGIYAGITAKRNKERNKKLIELEKQIRRRLCKLKDISRRAYQRAGWAA